MGCLRVKPGVRFDHIDPAGFRILATLDAFIRPCDYDLTITCGTEAHPVNSPHALGRAYDVRSKGLEAVEKDRIVRDVLTSLAEPGEELLTTSGGLACRHFFGWLEHPGEITEHVHIQQRRLTEFPNV